MMRYVNLHFTLRYIVFVDNVKHWIKTEKYTRHYKTLMDVINCNTSRVPHNNNTVYACVGNVSILSFLTFVWS